MRYFYSRVSTKEQNTARQDEVAKQYDCDFIFTDKQSGKDFNRHEYIRLKELVKPGDEVFVKELDRLGRNKQEMKEEIQWFKENGITLRILDVATTLIDFQGQDWIKEMVDNILIEVLGSFAEQERKKIRNRQREGIDLALERGVKFGRPMGNIDEPKREGETVAAYCNRVGISRSTYYKYRQDMV